MEQCRLEMEKLASSVALAEYEQEAGPARLAKLARSVSKEHSPAARKPLLPSRPRRLASECIAVPCRARDKTREQPDQER
jgi:hypothetical protein